MSTKVTPLGLRLFLEGVEVPVISAQVNMAPDAPSTATIQVVPTDMAMHLLPRTLVHLFYLDDEPLEHPEPSPRQAADGSYTEANFNRFDAPDKQYKLLFVGEVAGFNYGKNPSQRQIILQCMDLSTYWDSCYQWFADYSVGGNGLTDKSHTFSQGGSGLFNSVSGGHKWVIGQLLNSKPESPVYARTTGLLGGIIHLLEAVGGTRYRNEDDKGFNGVNDFFTIAELRYNILGMIGALEADDTSSRIYNEKAFFSWLRNGMTSMGSMLSFRDILNHVNRYVYHHIYPNPCARLKPEGVEQVLVPATVFRDDPIGSAVLSLCKRAHTSLGRASNNILVNDLINVNQTFSFVNGARVNVNKAKDAAAKLKSGDAQDVLNSLNEVSSILDHAMSLAQDAGISGAASDEVSTFDFAPQLDLDVGDALKILQDDLLGVVKAQSKANIKKKKNVEMPPRLYNQLILPECYFVAPPRCNVLFPDQYFQFSFSRNFMREVSRLSMASGLGRISGGGRQGSKLFSRNYFAPNITDVRNKHVFLTTSRGARILLPHEVHSGIIPKYEWANDGHRWANLAKKSGKDPFFGDGKVGYLQRLANFQFYLHRWSARTMSTTGVFNPHLVIGFPGLVMDRSLPAPAVVEQREKVLGRKWMPVQFLGKLVSMTHAVNQSGGSTSTQFTHCRTHRGLDDEFLSALSRETQEIRSKQQTVVIDTQELVNHFLYNNVKFILNPEDKKILLRQHLTGKLSKGRPVRGTKVYRGMKVLSIESVGSTTLNEEKTRALGFDNLDSEDVIRRSDPGASSEVLFLSAANDVIVKVPDKLTVLLEKSVRVGQPKERKESIESMLTPGWFSDIWTNKNISEKVYRPLLDTDAIVERVDLESAEQNEFFNRTLKEESAVLSAEVSEGENSETLFSFEGKSEIPGSTASLHVVPGSIEEAVDSLTIIYSMIRLRGGDVHDFIREYTKRPVANIEDMLGSFGLEYDDKGEPVTPPEGDAPIEGFHSRAFGDYNTDVELPTREGEKSKAGANALRALFPGVSSQPERKRLTNHKNKSTIRPELDPRGRARARVMEYIRELEFSRGLMG